MLLSHCTLHTYLTFVQAHHYSNQCFFLIAHSTTFLEPLSSAFSGFTKHMYNLFCLAKYSSCIHRKMKTTSIVPIPGIKPNCMSSIVAIFYISSTFSTIFIACSSSHTHHECHSYDMPFSF